MEIKKRSIHSVLLIITIAFLILSEILAVYPSLITPTERIDFAARDAAMRLRGTQEPDERIVIVAIDDFSFNWTGYSWPWSRDYMAEIIQVLNDSGAQIIGLDITLFEEADEGDEILAEALSKTPVSVGLAQIYTDHQGVESIRLPQPAYREVFDSIGITEIVLEDDAVARSIPVHKYDKATQEDYFNWAFEVTRLYEKAPPFSEFSPISITLGEEKIPLQNNRILINYRGPAGTYPTYSAAQVALGDYPTEKFKDKIVLIGATTVTLQDIYPSPFSSRERTSGVEIIANTIDTLLNRNYIRIAPWWVSILFLLLSAFLSHLIIRAQRPSLSLSLMVGSMLIYGIIYLATFIKAGLYLPFIAPEIMLLLGVIMPTLEQALSQEMEKRRVRKLFSRFISPEMVEQLISTQDISTLNKRSELTILFSDIRSFTTLS